jgi:hypothetical protein
MLESRTVGISIARGWRDVYDSVWRPEDFPKWAAALSRSPLIRDGEIWRTQGPDGPIAIRFTDRNAFGIMDHYVDAGVGVEIYVPMRIIANGEGSEVMLTLFRQPDMSEAKFAADAQWVAQDLQALKDLVAG